jgi:hypothetical protein
MAERDALRPIGTGRGSGGGDWTMAMARDLPRKRYSVLPLVPTQILTDGDVAPDQVDQFIALTGSSSRGCIDDERSDVGGQRRSGPVPDF